jgi:excisionase family DNA binding protein
VSRLLTIPEVAARLRLHRATVYRKIVAGSIPTVQMGKAQGQGQRPACVEGAAQRIEDCVLARGSPRTIADGWLALRTHGRRGLHRLCRDRPPRSQAARQPPARQHGQHPLGLSSLSRRD